MSTGAQTGTWAAGPVNVPPPHPGLQAGGAAVISQATCTFTFNGQNSSGATVTGSATVTLTAAATVLRAGQGGVLVDGDEASDPGSPPVPTFGNKLTVKSTRKLTSTLTPASG